MPKPRLSFLGATETVTGSRSLVVAGGKRVLVDCGLFQGFKNLRQRNRSPLPVKPSSLDAVVLTHAHLDHSGWLPRLIRDGYAGEVQCSQGTRALASILLPDSGHIQEADAERANRHGYTRHRPARPLYTEEEARDAVKQLRGRPMHEPMVLTEGVQLTLHRAGHIIGASMVRLDFGGQDLLFTGDIGRPHDPLMPTPDESPSATWLVVESTYGNRRHPTVDPEVELGGIVRRTVARGGHVIIPAFAVGRTQRILYHLRRLLDRGEIPRVPVYLNSPLAQDATAIFRAHPDDHRLDEATARALCTLPHLVRSPEESRRLNSLDAPAIIIAGSGMATGGRVLHHMVRYGPDSRNTFLFTGFQAAGTRGAKLLGGARSVRIFGEEVPIHAEVRVLDNLSAHADAHEIMEWLKCFKSPPRMTYVNHGEPAAADALRERIERELGWNVCVPAYREEVVLR